MNRRISIALGLALVLATANSAMAAVLRVVASTNDLASIAAAVGGDLIEVSALARSGSDPHHVEVLPSHMVRVARADLYLQVGLGLDAWATSVIDGSHNGKLTVVDCSAGIAVLEKPAGKVDASMGDVHPAGNPHYWLDPRNGALVARTIASSLGKLDPAHAADYDARAATFATAAHDLHTRGAARIAALSDRAVITYHRSWTYFADAFGLEVVQTIEPIPGIPPTARHLQALVELIRARRIGVVLEEPYFSEEGGEFLHRETGIRIVQLSASCDGVAPDAYLRHLQTALDRIAAGGR